MFTFEDFKSLHEKIVVSRLYLERSGVNAYHCLLDLRIENDDPSQMKQIISVHKGRGEADNARLKQIYDEVVKQMTLPVSMPIIGGGEGGRTVPSATISTPSAAGFSNAHPNNKCTCGHAYVGGVGVSPKDSNS